MRTLLFASRVTAVACVVWVTCKLPDASVTDTDATGGGTTVTVCDPFLPSIVAVITADPAATPVTRPAEFTVAIAELALVHATVRPVSVLPFALRAVAVSVSVKPTWRSEPGGEYVDRCDGWWSGGVASARRDERERAQRDERKPGVPLH